MSIDISKEIITRKCYCTVFTTYITLSFAYHCVLFSFVGRTVQGHSERKRVETLFLLLKNCQQACKIFRQMSLKLVRLATSV